MPKILQKNIYKTSVITLCVCLVFVVINVIRKLAGTSSGSIYYDMNIFIWVVSNPVSQSAIFKLSLPDYIFIAPYSEKERMDLLKKGFFWHFIAMGLWVMLLIILPFLIFDLLNNNMTQFFIGIKEDVLVLTYIFIGPYWSYISKINYKLAIFFNCAAFLGLVFFAGVAKTQINEFTFDIVFLSIDIIIGITLILICRFQLQKPLFEYLSDYEKSREINIKREQRI